jgi:MutS domain V
MKARLLDRNRDFDWEWALRATAKREALRTGRRPYGIEHFDPRSALPWNTEALTTDLALDTFFIAMAQGDECVFEVSRRVVLEATTGDLDAIQYRQLILQDCLSQPIVVRELYALAVQAVEEQKGHYLGSLEHRPDWVLRDSIETIKTLLEFLKRLKRIADLHAGKLVSEGWIKFFAMLKENLDEDYFATVQHHLAELKFPNGELLSAELGRANKGERYVLHQGPFPNRTWWARWTAPFEEKPSVFSFELHPRDESGFRALAELRDRGNSSTAKVLGQSADHLRDFFRMLRAELAFYIGCLNLHQQLVQKGEPISMPRPGPGGEARLSFRGLYDVCLALSIDGRAVGNDANADGKHLLMITGANTGGKSTFLRSVGLAQLMMQSGMFVPAESFCASLCHGLFTHYKREEDVSMKSGKFDEELSRMSEIIDHVSSQSMLLFNESFAATNEREGSQISRQIISALRENGARILCVTHMYELAHGFYDNGEASNALFLRAEREADGTRTFKLIEGEPLPTSFGEDLYNRIFSTEGTGCGIDEAKARVGEG